jgi:hypothetical protein
MSAPRHPRHRTSAPPAVRRLHADEPASARPATATDTDRDQCSPPAASTTGGGGRPRRRLARASGWLPRPTRGRALAMLAVSLVVLLGGTLAVHAAAAPTRLTAAQPAPSPPLPLPTVDSCTPASPLPICQLPTSPPPATGVPSPTTSACTGEGCLPQPVTPAPPATGSGTGQPGDNGGNGQADCGVFSITGCVTNAINGFFRGIVTDALNPLLDLLSQTLLTTPTPDSIPRIGQLWDNSWQILLVSYALLILIAGVLVMGYETVQTRYSIKEIAPRVVVGFLAGALSLWLATQGIEIANALAQSVMGGGVDATTAADTLKNLVLGSLNGGIFIIFIGLALAGMLLALLVTYVVRVALTLLLIAGAPLVLMFHALPQTEGIAYWWYKAYGGVLVIQVGQSGVLIIAFRVFLAPGGFTLFGPTVSGLANLLIAIALLYVLFKIPFWILGSLRGGGGRSVVGSLVRGFLAYKTFGLLGGGGGRTPRPSGGGLGGNGSGSSSGGGGGPANPYAHTRTAANGQYVLPLPGVRRTRPAPTPRPAPTSKKPPGAAGRQLALPLGGAWPENKPVLGRDGQYRLPLDVQRVTPTPPPAAPSQPGSGSRRHSQQLEFAFDPYRGNRPSRTGQYPLPLGVTRTPRPPSPPPTPPPSRPRDTQLELPFDPYQGNRPTRTGQYPLPLEGVHRVPPATPASPPPAAPPRPAARGGRQLRLPLDLPKPPKPTSGGTP